MSQRGFADPGLIFDQAMAFCEQTGQSQSYLVVFAQDYLAYASDGVIKQYCGGFKLVYISVVHIMFNVDVLSYMLVKVAEEMEYTSLYMTKSFDSSH
jgi:hypothetical protein